MTTDQSAGLTPLREMLAQTWTKSKRSLPELDMVNPMQAIADIVEADFNCLVCGDAGVVRLRTGGWPEYKKCAACFRADEVQGVPEPRLGNTFENFDLTRNPKMAAALDRCRALLASEKEWCILMVGGYGTGKTHLAIATLQRFGMGEFWKVPDFLDYCRHRIFDNEESQAQIIAEYASKDFLVLDDLGVEKRTEWADEVLYRILDKRAEYQEPTIITTNVPLSQIDGRILSRFGRGLIACEGADMRLA